MISWIQRYFQKHFKLVFLIVLLAMAIPLVFIYNQSSGMGRAERKASSQPFFGHNLAAENEMAALNRDAQLSSELHQENANLMIRLTALAIADQLHIPGPTENELKEMLKTLPIFAGENGQFDATVYKRFQDNIRKGNQSPEPLIRRVLEDDFRVSRVALLLGGPGYLQPHEVKAQLERFESQWTLGIANVDYKSFTPAITPTDANLAKYFSDNSGRYEIQPQVSLRYAEFSAVDFIDKVTASEGEIKAFYDANPARFTKPEANADDKKPAKPADFASVRLQVELAYKLDRAVRLATKAASDFTLELFEKKITPGTAAFDALLASHKLALKDLAPFTHDEPPEELGRSSDVANEAFKLGKDRPNSDAIALNTGSVVLFLKETISARQPILAEVKAKVSADYVEEERRQRFVALGKTLRSQIEARLKAGDTFDKAIAAVSASSTAKIEAKTLAPFTMRQRPEDLDYLVFGTLDSLKKGSVSEMVLSPDKGLIVYAADKKAPDSSATNPQYLTYQFQIARGTAARNSGEYLKEIAEAELAKSTKVDAP